MIQKERGVFFGDVQCKRLANYAIARGTEQLRRGEIDFFNVPYAVETNITNRRKIEKIDVTLNGRFQRCRGMFKDRSIGRMLGRAVSSGRPICRKFRVITQLCLCPIHVRPNDFAGGSDYRCLTFAMSAL